MKKRKKQLKALLLAIVFIVSSIGSGMMSEARTVNWKLERGEYMGIVYPGDVFKNYSDQYSRYFVVGNQTVIAYGSYDFLWAIPNEGLSESDVAWALQSPDTVDSYSSKYNSTDKKVEIDQAAIEVGADIVMTVDGNGYFSDDDDVTYQWYQYDEKELHITMPENDYWKALNYENGVYSSSNKGDISVAYSQSIPYSIQADEGILDGYKMSLEVNYSRDSDLYMKLPFTFTMFENVLTEVNDNVTTITPSFNSYRSDTYEVMENLISMKISAKQVFDRAIEGATGKTLTLSASDSMYDVEKQYYCVAKKKRPDEKFVLYPSQAVNVELIEHVHDYTKFVSNEDGTHKQVCSGCGETKPDCEAIACSGGKATCKEKAKCSICEAEYGDIGSHTVKTTVATKATASQDGRKETKCTVCGKTTKTEVIYAAKTVKLDKAVYTYDGKTKKPSVVIKDSKGKEVSASNYTVAYPTSSKKVGEYTVKVTFKGNYSGSKKLTFKINPVKTAISSLTAGSKSFTVKWAKKTAEVTGYQLQYSTSDKFKTGNKTVTITKNGTVKNQIKNLKASKKYFVRIRTYKTVGKVKFYSEWSAKKAVTTKN